MPVPATLHFSHVEGRFYPPSPVHPSGHSEFFAVYEGGGSTRCHISLSPQDADQLLRSMEGIASSAPEPPPAAPSKPTPQAQLAPPPEPVDWGDPRVAGEDDPDPVSERGPAPNIEAALPLGQPVKLDNLMEAVVPITSARRARTPRTLPMDAHGNPQFGDDEGGSSSPLAEEEVRSL